MVYVGEDKVDLPDVELTTIETTSSADVNYVLQGEHVMDFKSLPTAHAQDVLCVSSIRYRTEKAGLFERLSGVVALPEQALEGRDASR
jgi:hypothetical protein